MGLRPPVRGQERKEIPCQGAPGDAVGRRKLAGQMVLYGGIYFFQPQHLAMGTRDQAHWIQGTSFRAARSAATGCVSGADGTGVPQGDGNLRANPACPHFKICVLPTPSGIPDSSPNLTPLNPLCSNSASRLSRRAAGVRTRPRVSVFKICPAARFVSVIAKHYDVYAPVEQGWRACRLHLSGRSLGEGRRRLDVQSDLGNLSFLYEGFVAETTIREANNKAWGNHLVAGLGSLSCSSVNFDGTPRAMVGLYGSHLFFWIKEIK
jgi:hypothetical protein